MSDLAFFLKFAERDEDPNSEKSVARKTFSSEAIEFVIILTAALNFSVHLTTKSIFPP